MKGNYLKITKQKKNSQQPTTNHQTQSGITLVALVITIIVLLILAGVALSMITGGDGLFARANNVASKYNEQSRKEATEVEKLLDEITMFADGFMKSIDFEVIVKDKTKIKVDINVELQKAREAYGVKKYCVYIDDKIVAEDTTDIIELPLNEGTYRVKVEAVDINDKIITSEEKEILTTYTTFNTASYSRSVSSTSTSYPLPRDNTITFITYGTCNINLKELYIEANVGNVIAANESTVTVSVYGYTDESWQLLKTFSAVRPINTTSKQICKTTLDFSDNNKIYTDFYVSIHSTDNERLVNAKLTPIGY